MPESVSFFFFRKDGAFVRHGNSIKFYLLQTAILPWSLNIVGQMELKLCSGFKVGDLDLWPYDRKINKGLLPNMDNHPTKFEHCGPNGT
jgi:hypothetical protein